MKKPFLNWILFIAVLTTPPLHAAEAAKPSGHATVLQEILILNSYHPGYAWSDDEQAGIIDVFRAKDKNWLPVVEYLDFRRLPDGRHLAELKQLFQRKYQNKKFSVVIAMDNPALGFAVDNQSELFGNAPIVFCGINNYTPSLLKGRSDVTGIMEDIDITGTIEVMLRLHPATREIFSPNDYTATGLAVRKELEALVPRFGAKVRFRFNDPLTMEELLKELERLPKNSLVLEIGFITDKSSRTFDVSETTQLFYEHSPVPIYSTYEQRLGFGIVGGKLLSARIHGADAARIALRVLAGEKASAIPVVLESDSQFMFDYKVMSRFGIPLSALPEGSTVINQPVSFYAAHRGVIQTAWGIIGILTVVIFLLMVIIIQHKRAKLELSESEKQYRMLFNTIDEGFSIIEVIFDENEKPIDYRFLSINPSFEKQTGLISAQGKRMRELAPKHEEYWFEIYGKIALTGQPARFVNRAEQLHRWYDVYAFRVGEPEDRQVAILFNDITERKQAEEALHRSEENFRRSLDDSPLGVRIVTEEGDTIYANRTILDIYGYDSVEELNTTPIKARHTPESHAEFQIRREKRKQGDDVPSEYEVSIVRKDGGVRHLQTFRKTILWDGEKQFQVIYRDITDRKWAEEALRESELRYRELFNNISSGVAIYEVKDDGNDFIFKDFNKAGERLDGDRKEDIIGMSIYQARLGIKEFGLLDVLKRVWKTGIPEHYPTSFYKDERITKWFENFVYKLPTGEIVAVYDDVTERERMEEELHVTLEKYRVLFDVFPLGISITDAVGHIIETNRESVRLLGISREEHTSRNYVGPEWQIIRTNGTPMPVHEYASVRAMKENCLVENVEMGIVKGDQEITWINVSAAPIPLKNFGVAIAYGDITDRKRTDKALRKSEELYRSLFENMLNGLAYCRMLFDQGKPQDFIYLNVNSAFESLTGLKNVVGRKVSEVIPGIRESDAGLFEIYGRVALTGKSEKFERYFEALKMWFSMSVYSTEKEHFVAVFDVITQRKLAEEALYASREQMRALAGRLQEVREEERTNIAREIHDELGGALTGLKIDFSLLTRIALKIKNETVRASLLAGIDSMTKFIDATIHTVRRIAMELRPGVLDDLGLVAALEWQLNDFQKRTGIRCEYFLPVGDISLGADLSTTLFRIFQEALTNVVRHSGATEVHVHLSGDDDSCRLEVEDNGKGIEKEKTLSSKSLGLLGMRERVQMFGGRITVTGTPGTGTKVTVEIPLAIQRKEIGIGKETPDDQSDYRR